PECRASVREPTGWPSAIYRSTRDLSRVLARRSSICPIVHNAGINTQAVPRPAAVRSSGGGRAGAGIGIVRTTVELLLRRPFGVRCRRGGTLSLVRGMPAQGFGGGLAPGR